MPPISLLYPPTSKLNLAEPQSAHQNADQAFCSVGGLAAMPLTAAELETIRDECLADDVEIPAEAVAWIEEEAVAFFESGGTELPRKPGLQGAEVLAYYEVRKPTVNSSSSAFLMDALHSALHLEGEPADRGGSSAEPEPGGLGLGDSPLASTPVAEDGEKLLRSLGLAAKWPAFKADGLVSVERMLRALEHDPKGLDKQLALMSVKRGQRKLLVGALRQSAGAAAGSPGGAGANGDGYVTEDESDFDFDEYAGSGVT